MQSTVKGTFVQYDATCKLAHMAIRVFKPFIYSICMVYSSMVAVPACPQMRATIKAVFPDRDVSVMVRPALQEAHLQSLDALTYTQLRPEFRRVRSAHFGGVIETAGRRALPVQLVGNLCADHPQYRQPKRHSPLLAGVTPCDAEQNDPVSMPTHLIVLPMSMCCSWGCIKVECRLWMCCVQDLEQFLRCVKSKARPMAVGGTLISGQIMAGLATAYVDAVNNGKPISATGRDACGGLSRQMLCASGDCACCWSPHPGERSAIVPQLQ